MDNSCQIVTVKRESVTEDILNLYKTNSDIASSFVTFKFNNEEGMDMDGVKREVYSLFWEGAMMRFFDGSNTVVPKMGPEIQDNDLDALGRIINHGFVLTGIFPIMINKGFMTGALLGRDSLSDDDIVDCFFEFVSDYDSLQLKRVMDEVNPTDVFSEQSHHYLMEFLSEFEVQTNPRPSNIRDIITRVAKTELLSKPSLALDIIGKGLQDHNNLWEDCGKDDVFHLYDKLAISPGIIASLLTVDEYNLTKEKQKVFTYLKKYVRSLNNKDICLFTRFTTGSSMNLVKEIKVVFHGTEGIPYITAHTCSAIIDLPSRGYISFSDFKSQFDNVLYNPYSWEFAVV